MKKKQQSSGSLIAAILLVALTHFFFNFSSWRTLFYTVLALALTKFILDCIELRLPKPYVVLATNEQRRETRPFSDVALHVLLFKWLRVILCDSRLYQVLLARLNEDFLSWDETFRSQGKDPETEVLRFCEKWGVDTTSWPWSKAPGEYATANEFFGRAFSAARSVESSRLGSALVASPATAVVSWFPSVRELPRLLKNEAWSLDGVGVPNVKAYSNQPAALFYLSPADYHRFHAPISGHVEHLELLGMDRSSLTVKPYIYKSVNILRRNRRAVCVVASDKVPGLKVAMVIVGGITVDSIRLSFISCMGDGSGGELPPQSKAKGREQKEDAGPLYLRKGQEIGSFARGGSAVALLFTRSMELATERAVGAIAAGMDFKIGVGDDLAVLARRES